MVSPRKSRRKSPCFSSTTTSTQARASSNPNMSPHGPPPTMQQRVESCSAGIAMRSTNSTAGMAQAFRTDGAPSNPDHAFGHNVAGEQERAEGDDHDRRADLDAAHRQHAVAGARVGEVLGPRPGADGDRGDQGNRDGGSDSHDEGRGDARPEQSLRQREAPRPP